MGNVKVTVLSATEKPVDVIGIAAGTCYGKSDVNEKHEKREKRIRHCYNNGHLSVCEHAVITFRIEGISRACMAQLTRHRLVSFCVESQRYCKYDLTNGDDWCVVPPSIDAIPEAREMFIEGERRDALEYMALLEMGIKPEDARYKLPESMKTNLMMTCNLRQLFHIFDMRMDKAAQWEIRELAHQMWSEAAGINDQWDTLMLMYFQEGAE